MPERGCVGAAVREPTGAADGEIGGPVFAEDAEFTTLEQAQNDERTRAVIRQWSPCTTEAGFDCPDPLAALSDPRWRRTPRPTPQELRIATADAGYRRQVIEADPEATAKAKAAVEFQVAAAARVTAGRATGRPGAAADGTSQPFASRANHPDSR